MPLLQADRIAFSNAIVTAAQTIAGLQAAQAQTNQVVANLQALDTANKNLLAPVTVLINSYQTELQNLDGNGRTQFTEQNIIDASNKVLGNFFFPNNTTVSVPDLAPYNNVWTQVAPFALGYGIGKNYSEAYSSISSESTQITGINGQFSTAQETYTDMQLTTGIDEDLDDDIQTILTNIAAAVTALQATANAELVAIAGNADTNSTRIAQNTTATTNVNTLISAMATWQALPNFESTGSGPSKLHSTNFATLQTAFTTRNSFTSGTRIPQLNTNLGSITQNVTNGNITASSGFYGQRYSYLNLRLNILSGTLSQASSLGGASSAQSQIIANTENSVATYSTLISIGLLIASATSTNIISIQNANLFSPGDIVYVYADTQIEILTSIKSINNNAITLSNAIPSQYTTLNMARLYKDLT